MSDLNNLLIDIKVANKIRTNYTPKIEDMNKLQSLIEELEDRIGDVMNNMFINVPNVELVKQIDS